MLEIIACPRCDRKLRLPDSVFGQQVQCPACKNTFIAQPMSEAVPLPPMVVPVEEDIPPRGGYDDYPPERPYRSEFDYQDDTGGRPHRGAAVLALGIISIVVACIPALSSLLAIIAISMASTDLQDMARRRMDRSGQGLTQTGQILGYIGLAVNIIFTLFACLTGGFRRF